MSLTAIESINTLVVVHLNAFEFEQLLQLYAAEIPCKQQAQAGSVASVDYAFGVDLKKTYKHSYTLE